MGDLMITWTSGYCNEQLGFMQQLSMYKSFLFSQWHVVANHVAETAILFSLDRDKPDLLNLCNSSLA